MQFLSLLILLLPPFITPIILHPFNINFLPVVVPQIFMPI
ncbi:hypothetical protein, partial [Staphylococcus epidermidis]